MGTKLKPGRHDCYDRALLDEPLFVLLARDRSAAFLTGIWSAIRSGRLGTARNLCASLLFEAEKAELPTTDYAEAAEAARCMEDMMEWRQKSGGRWRLPQPPVHTGLTSEAGKLLYVDVRGAAGIERDGENVESHLYRGLRACSLGIDPRDMRRAIIDLVGGTADPDDDDTPDTIVTSMSADALEALADECRTIAGQLRILAAPIDAMAVL